MSQIIHEGMIVLGKYGLRLPVDEAIEVAARIAKAFLHEEVSPGQYVPAPEVRFILDLNPHTADLAAKDIMP